MLCHKCGKDIGDDAFCKYCGSRINVVDTAKKDVDIFSNGYKKADYNLLKTQASENGQKGLKIYVDGYIKDVRSTGSTNFMIINTNEDNEWVIRPINSKSNLDFVKEYIGRHVRINCSYEGKSEKLQMPVAIFEDIYDYNSKTSTRDEDSISNESEKQKYVNDENSKKKNGDEEDIAKIKDAWGEVVSAFGNFGKNYVKAVKELYGNNESNNEKQVAKQETKIKEEESEVEKLHNNLRALKEMYDIGLLNLDEYNEKRNTILNNGKKEVNKQNSKKVRKCPYCGEILEAYTLECPTCGNKISDGYISSAMEEFKDGLNRIDGEYAQTMLNVTKGDNSLGMYEAKSSFHDKKAEYIRNFIIPVSVNDMLDFMVLAKSNVVLKLYKKKIGIFNMCGYGDWESVKNAKKTSDAWFSMMQQIYDKACVSLKDGETFNTIKNMYEEVRKQMIVF